jgi:hypothetical protein
MTDVFLYSGEPNPSDVRLRDPTQPSTITTILTPIAGNISLAGQVASIVLILAAVSGVLTIGGNTPSLTSTLAPTEGAVVKGGNAPNINTGLVPTTGSVVKTGNNPTLALQLQPLVGALVKSGLSPSLAWQLVTGSGTVIKNGYVPTVVVSGGGSTTLNPLSGLLSFLGYIPDIYSIPPFRPFAMNRLILEPKSLTEVRFEKFDFTSLLDAGESVTSSTVTATVYSGVDASPSSMISGSASVSNNVVTQKIQGGVVGVTYGLVCTANTNLGQTLVQAAYLVVTSNI